MTRYTRTDTDALLAAFAGAADYSGYWHAFRNLENACNYLENNGRAGEGMDLRKEFVLINRAVVPVINAKFQSIPTYSAAELIARALPQPSHKAA